MENLDKLFQLYESDSIDLMWQLTEGLGISKFDMIKLLFDKYKYLDKLGNTRFSFKLTKNYLCICEEFSMIATMIFGTEYRHKTLDDALLKLIENE